MPQINLNNALQLSGEKIATADFVFKKNDLAGFVSQHETTIVYNLLLRFTTLRCAKSTATENYLSEVHLTVRIALVHAMN